jgi:ADP-heptose:LPS heptosyltransferase
MKQKRILISRPDRIGDVVLSTPIPRAIKKQFPGSYVAILLREYTKDLYLNNPYVDAIITIDDLLEERTTFFTKAKEIHKYRFTHSLALLPNQTINYLLFCAGIKTRIGEGTRLYQFITFTKSVSRKNYIPLRHEADYCMDLARKIGVASNDLASEIFLSEDEASEIKTLKEQFLQGKECLIGVHSSSGKSAPNLPIEKYRELILTLKEICNYRVVVTDDLIPDDVKNIEGVVYSNTGLPLRESIKRFASLDCLISASTGPMHICAGLKVPTVSLFCPLTACSPLLWGPQGNKSIIIQPTQDYCLNQCPNDPKVCHLTELGGVQIEDVISGVKDVLGSRSKIISSVNLN